MYIIRRNPINEVQNLVTSVFNGSGLRTNIEELESDYIVTVEVPGVSKKDITIDYEDSYLTISVEKKEENSNKNPTVNSVQRDYMAGEVSKDITKRILLPNICWRSR